MAEGGQALGVFEHGGVVVQGAGADHYQQTWVVTIEDGADRVALLLHLARERGAEWQLFAQLGGAGQRRGLAAGLGVDQMQIGGFGGGAGIDGYGHGGFLGRRGRYRARRTIWLDGMFD